MSGRCVELQADRMLCRRENQEEMVAANVMQSHRAEMGLALENKVVPRRIFISKEDKVGGGWKTSENDELHNLYPSPNIIQCQN
jgi:hypothetical protein